MEILTVPVDSTLLRLLTAQVLLKKYYKIDFQNHKYPLDKKTMACYFNFELEENWKKHIWKFARFGGVTQLVFETADDILNLKTAIHFHSAI
ncbi:hypothetical protein [Treponema denticola]|uniref:hypothetical protein n=1 Tax=Treponema denticola TaxID=158 RepID=UPI0020A4D1D3|nr:hypothetical protein [Treponema denticola]